MRFLEEHRLTWHSFDGSPHGCDSTPAVDPSSYKTIIRQACNPLMKSSLTLFDGFFPIPLLTVRCSSEIYRNAGLLPHFLWEKCFPSQLKCSACIWKHPVGASMFSTDDIVTFQWTISSSAVDHIVLFWLQLAV